MGLGDGHRGPDHCQLDPCAQDPAAKGHSAEAGGSMKQKQEPNESMQRYASTRMLTKIMTILDDNYPFWMHRKEIIDLLNSDNRRIDDAVLWLGNHGLIERKLDRGIKVFRIKKGGRGDEKNTDQGYD